MAVARCGTGLPRAQQRAWRTGLSAGNRADNPKQESSPSCWVMEEGGGDPGLLLRRSQERSSGQTMLPACHIPGKE